MADASILPQAVSSRQGSPHQALLAWIGSAGRFMRKRPVASGGVTRSDARETAPEQVTDPGRRPLLNAYAASTLQIAREAAALHPRAALNLGPVAIQALVGQVVGDLEPRARQAGLMLLRDADSRCEGVCCADPVQLRRVLSHLLLRALSMEQAPGHIRVMTTLTRYEAQILILSRTPETTLAVRTHSAHDDLVAPQRLLHAMGGSLVLEPRRAGYLPLCLALPALFAASALRAA